VLGGTGFVGRAVVTAGVAHGWAVTTFNWDRRQPTDGGIERLFGDRTKPADLHLLQRRKWDLVVDTWHGAPNVVAESCHILAGRAGVFAYVSSLTARTVGSAAIEFPCRTDYPFRKAAAEQAVVDRFGTRSLIVRAGLILGPWEYPGRLPFWLQRMALFDHVLAPAPRERSIQFIDVRDLAEWLIRCGRHQINGRFNAVCPTDTVSMRSILETARTATGQRTSLHWVPEGVLMKAGVKPWTGLPLWLPPAYDESLVYNTDVSEALSSGLLIRPAEETVRGTADWLFSLGDEERREALGQRDWMSRRTEESILDDLGMCRRED
jgi:2'-hydroxyisoflavone reductase